MCSLCSQSDDFTFQMPHYRAVVSCTLTDKLPPVCLRRQEFWLSLLFSHQTCIYQHWNQTGRGRVSISHHLTSRFQFRLCSMPSIVGSLAVSRSAWFEKRDLRLGGIWIIVLQIMIRAKSMSGVSWRMHLVFLILIFLSVIYTLCIFLSCTSEVLFALNVLQFDNVL